MRKLKFTQTSPADQKLELDGEDISPWVIGMRVDVNVGERPSVQLDLSVFEVETGADETSVYLSPRTGDLLKRLGWTPPEES